MKLKNVMSIDLKSQNLNSFLKKNRASLNLQMLKTKTYEKKLFNKNSLFSIEEKFIQLKIVLIVIYSYHYFNKTILFLGIPNKIASILAKIKHSHVFLPSTIWLNGAFTSKNSSKMRSRYRQSKKSKSSFARSKLFSVVKLPKLIVLLNPVQKPAIINEIHRLRIPMIILYTNKMSAKNFSYKISRNSTQLDLNLNSIFLNLLNFILLKKSFV